MKLWIFAGCALVCSTLWTPVVRAEQVGAGAGAADGSAVLASGTLVKAVLAKPVDSLKLKVGDAVYATATEDVKDGGVVVKKGSPLVGHVTAVSAKGEGEACASVGILFDHAVVGGRAVGMHSLVQAIAAAPAQMAAGEAIDGAALSHASNELTALAGEQPAGTPSRGGLYPASTGVAGLRGISLMTATSAGSEGSLVSSTRGSVHLGNGTRMVLRVAN